MYALGDKVVLTKEAKENYEGLEWINDTLEVTHIATSTKEHPGYDESLKGCQLMDLKDEVGLDIHCSLYDYEVERAK